VIRCAVMWKRVLLIFFVSVAAFLAYGAWNQSPGDDPDNQGGVALALLGILALICFVIVKLTRVITGRIRPHRETPTPRARDGV
jgi:hypothetical protein